jgi:hypothetical protein
MSADQSLDPQAAAAIARVRRLMLIASVTTFIALAFVLGVIGYRVFHMGESADSAESAPDFADVTEALPAGAKVLSTAIGNDHIVVTIEIGGVTEIRTFDPDTLKPLGRLRLAPKP